jgi:two-component system sensor histidine kinase/response regulator
VIPVPPRPRNLLPLIVAITLAAAYAAWRIRIGPSVGAAYMCVVLLSLRSSRVTHAYIAALLGTGLVLFQMYLASARGFTLPLATSIVHAGLMISSMWVMAVLGVRTMHLARRESAALAEATAVSRQAEGRQRILDRLLISTEAANLWVWEVDSNSQLVWDQNPPKVLGLDRATTAERWKAFDRCMQPEELARINGELRTAFAERRGRLSHRFTAIAVDGKTPVYLQTRADISYDEQGKAIRVIGVTADISEEVQRTKRLEQELVNANQLQERLSIAARAAGLWIWERNPHSREFIWDANSPKELGLENVPYAEFQTRLKQFAPPEDVMSSGSTISKALEAKARNYSLSYRTRNADGTLCHRLSTAEIVYAENGEPRRIIGVTRDITKDVHTTETIQRQAEEERVLRERLSTAAKAAGIHCWQVSYPGPQLVWSENVAAELGEAAAALPYSELLQRMNENVHPDDVGKLNKAAAPSAHPEEIQTVEFRRVMPDGTLRTFRTHERYFNRQEGGAITAIGATIDVTEHVNIQARLKEQAEQAQAANVAKSAFLANVSHEIRTPMNGIIGMTHLLLDTPLNETQREFAETVRGSADALLTVINDILDFSKIEAGKLDIENIEMDLRGNVEDVGAMLKFQAESRALELHIHVHPEVPDRVLGDPQRIRQCLINLVGNAIKFTRDGRIVVEVFGVGNQNGRMLLHFEVRDTGIGLAPEVAQKLFQPFTQADSSTTRQFGGTGLGLSIVKRLVEMMGGTVGVDSELGRGSNFWFTLPLETVITRAAPVTALDAVRESAATRRYSGSALLVEDNPINQKVASRFLERFGLSVTIANDGAAGVRAFEARRYDLVLMDLQMPVMDGLQATQRIREIEASRTGGRQASARTPVIALTANAMTGQRERCIAAGMDGFLSKPLQSEQLHDVVARYCSGMQTADAQQVERLLNAVTPAPAMNLDVAQLLDMTGNDMEFIRDILGTYQESVDRLMVEMRQALNDNDRQALASAAHKLRGASANIHAQRARDVCALLEDQAETLPAEQGRAQIDLLSKLLDAVNAEFQMLLKPAVGRHG